MTFDLNHAGKIKIDNNKFFTIVEKYEQFIKSTETLAETRRLFYDFVQQTIKESRISLKI